ncbi:MAG: DUF3606 domain-containing protein [Acidobacteriota bacterium]
MVQETKAAEDSQSQADVDISSEPALRRWSEALGVTTEALESAVKAVGTRVDKIKQYLTTGLAGRQSDG